MMISRMFLLVCLLLISQSVFSQKEKEDLGDKEYIIVKDYKPVLAESYKISDVPEGDTSTYTAPPLNYKLHTKQAETNYETATIKAIRYLTAKNMMTTKTAAIPSPKNVA